MASASALFDNLLAVLAAEAAELRRLLPLLEAQQTAVCRGDAGAVAELSRRQAPLVRELIEREAARRALTEKLGALVGVDPQTLTLSRLLELVGSPRSPATALRTELRDLLERLRAVNAKNGFLLERALGYLERLLGHLLASLALGGSPTYAASGRPAPVVALRLVDREA